MASAIEATVKALVVFESELENAKAGASEARRRAIKDVADWAATAKSSAIKRAQELASERVAKARDAAEAEAENLRKRGESELKAFEASISRNRAQAARLVAARLLGEKE